MKRVILLGKGSLAIKIAKYFLSNSSTFKLEYIVPSIPEPTWDDSLVNFAKKERVNIIESGNLEDIPGVKNKDWFIDLAFSVFYSKIIKKWFIDKCNKILNLHNSPLPKYRGVRPINWALKNNEIEHGVTIHEITPGIDDGPIVAQLKYSIYPYFEEVEDVYKKALDYGYLLFLKTIPFIDKIKPRPQDENSATYYSKKSIKYLKERSNWTKEISD